MRDHFRMAIVAHARCKMGTCAGCGEAEKLEICVGCGRRFCNDCLIWCYEGTDHAGGWYCEDCS